MKIKHIIFLATCLCIVSIQGMEIIVFNDDTYESMVWHFMPENVCTQLGTLKTCLDDFRSNNQRRDEHTNH